MFKPNIPTEDQMNEYWNRSLQEKVKMVDKVWILGNLAKEFFNSKVKDNSLKVISTIHPSKRNISLYTKNKETILKTIKNFIYGNT